MKKNFKKYLSILLVAVMAFSTLTLVACNPNGLGKDADTEPVKNTPSLSIETKNSPFMSLSAKTVTRAPTNGNAMGRAQSAHIGYCIGSRWWRNGYASEALAAVISFFFSEVHARRVESQHDPENPASGAVMRKCGMQYEGTLRCADWSNRGIVDACIYSILAQ